MGQEEVDRIKAFFSENNIETKYTEHEPVLTSQEAAETRGVKLEQGIKAILFTNGQEEFVIGDVPAHKKVDMKKIAEEMQWSKSKTRMATPEEVLEKTGCKIGSVPPFGHKEKIKIFYSPEIFENQVSTFNIGLRTHSVELATKDMKKVFEKVGATEGNFAK